MVPDLWKPLPWPAAKPEKRPHLETLRDANPDHTATRLVRQRIGNRDDAGPLSDAGLKLNVSNYRPVRHDQIVPVRVELRAKDLDIDDATAP